MTMVNCNRQAGGAKGPLTVAKWRVTRSARPAIGIRPPRVHPVTASTVTLDLRKGRLQALDTAACREYAASIPPSHHDLAADIF
jgi:hypothetical protein